MHDLRFIILLFFNSVACSCLSFNLLIFFRFAVENYSLTFISSEMLVGGLDNAEKLFTL